MSIKKEYRDLEMKVHNQLRDVIGSSTIKSKHYNGNVLDVNVFGYDELGIIDDKLTFLDANGLHYSLYSDCDLEDLIDILKEIKILNPTKETVVTIQELSDSYEVDNIYNYVCDSVINGQPTQARKIAKECKEMLNYSYSDLRDATQQYGRAIEDRVIEIFCD